MAKKNPKSNDVHVQLLEKKITDLECKLNNYKNKLIDNQALSERYSNFIDNFNHELLTPLNAIIGLLELSLKMPLTPKLQDYLIQAQASCKKLNKFAKNAQTLTQLNDDQIILKQHAFDLHELLEDLVLDYIKKIYAKKLIFELEIESHLPFALIGDPERLSQVLGHLLDNAIKFSEKGMLSLSIRLISNNISNICLEFSVKDNGIGIADTDLENILKPFYQGDGSSTRKYDGVGFGLSLCKQFVELMNGHFSIESIPKQGSSFIFELCFKEQTKITNKKYQLPDSLFSCRVLVIDIDKQSLHKSLNPLLEDFKFNVLYIDNHEKLMDFFSNDKKHKNSFELLFINLSSKDDKLMTLNHQIEALSKETKAIALVPYENRNNYLEVYSYIHIDKFINMPVTKPILFNTINDLYFSGKVKPYLTVKEQVTIKKINNNTTEEHIDLTNNLAQLAVFLGHGDQYEAEKLAQVLKKSYREHDLDLLLKHIRNFDFDEALENLLVITSKKNIHLDFI